MFVYGIRCAPTDLLAITSRIHGSVDADYYMDYGLLIFPQFTCASTIDSNGKLTAEHWDNVKRIVENSGRPYVVQLEHPWITDEQSEIVRIIKDAYPTADTDWFYVPTVSK